MAKYVLERCIEVKYLITRPKARAAHVCSEHDEWILPDTHYELHQQSIASERGRFYPPWRGKLCMRCVRHWKVLLAAERRAHIEKDQYVGELGERIHAAYEAGIFRKEIEWQMLRHWFPTILQPLDWLNDERLIARPMEIMLAGAEKDKKVQEALAQIPAVLVVPKGPDVPLVVAREAHLPVIVAVDPPTPVPLWPGDLIDVHVFLGDPSAA